MTEPLNDDCVIGTIVPNKLLPKFGQIAVLFSHLDIEMNRCLWQLMDANESTGRAVTQSILNFSTRLEMFATLARLKQPDEHHKRISDIRYFLSVANDDRNRLTHDEFYWGNPKTLEFGVVRLDPEAKKNKMYNFDVAAMDDLVTRLFVGRIILQMHLRDDERWLTEPLPSLDKSPTLRLQQSRQKQKSRGAPKPPP